MYILICFGLTKRTVLLLLFVMVENLKNALDTNNEKEIMEHLHRFYRGRTVVVVAHRLSTVEACDYVYWVDKGMVRMEGNPKQVLPAYADFLAVQNTATPQEKSEN